MDLQIAFPGVLYLNFETNNKTVTVALIFRERVK